MSSSSTRSTRTASGLSTSLRARYSSSSATSFDRFFDLEQLLHGLGGLRALAEPVLDLLLVELDQRRIVLRVVAPDDLDELAVARRARVGHDDAVDRVLLRPDARQPHSYRQLITSVSSIASCACWTSSPCAGGACGARRPRPGSCGKLALAHALHHLLHLLARLEQAVDLLDGRARAAARCAAGASRRSPSAARAPAASSRGRSPRRARTASRRRRRCPRAACRARGSA